MKKLVSILITIAALAWVIRKVNPGAVMEAFGNARLSWLFAALGVFGFSLFVAALRWHLLLRLNASAASYNTSLRALLVSHCFNTVLFGSAGGDVARTVFYHRWFQFPLVKVIASTLYDRVFIFSGFALLVIATFLLGSGHEKLQLEIKGLRPELIVGAAVAAGLVAALLFWWKRDRLKTLFEQGRTSLRVIFHLPGLMLFLLFLSFLTQLLLAVSFCCAVTSVAHSFPGFQFFWVYPLILLCAALPISVGGLGVREGSSILLLGFAGLGESSAVAASLLFFTVSCLWVIPGVFFFYEQQKQVKSIPPSSISCVVPVLNEESALRTLLPALQKIPEIHECLVVDGGSSDRTVEIAAKLGARVLVCTASRGGQMRRGVEESQSDVVWFVHADSNLSPNSGRAILNALHDPAVVGGGLWKTFHERHPLLLGSRFKCLWRLWFARRIMADQTIFVRRSSLEQAGGVPDQKLMEEFELCRRLRKQGRLVLADSLVRTSARRFLQNGVLRTYALMWRVMILYYLKVPPERLEEIYRAGGKAKAPMKKT